MLQTAGRLTLYGLIAAVDVDLRQLVRKEILEQIPLVEAMPGELFEKLRDRSLKDGHPEESSLPDYLDLGDSLALLRRHQAILPSSLSRLVKRYGGNFDKLIPVRNRVMHARPILLSDYPIADDIAKIVREFPATYFPSTRDFDDRVRRDPHHVFSLDASAISRDDDRLPNNLPLPDFDETGFVGREKEQSELKRLCKSQWPVITVVGEGGYGKTALALQVAYDILDDDSFDFDAIVWTTAKSVRLTHKDIENIDEAITSSLGVIRVAAEQLAGSEVENPLQEAISYLNSFKILLIIDNLETVLDPLLVQFLRELNGQSKVITTSRVGVGQLSYSFPLGELQLNEAVRLLRTLAKARHVDDIAKAKASILETYCKKMKLNAGFIKWFLTSVQFGKRPDQVLANPKQFLDFCVAHVFEHVSEDAKLVTRAMLAAPGKQSLPVISYLTGLAGDQLELALASLQSANILKMSTSFGENFSDTVYELSELPRLYILKNHPPSAAEDAEFKRRKREVVATFDRYQAEGVAKYATKSIACRTPSDSVLARLLVSALDLSNRAQNDAALEKVQQAISLDASFSESYRVEAQIQQRCGNNIGAEEAFETAMELDSRSAPLKYRYAMFLLRQLHDPARAYIQLEAAWSLDPTNPRIAVDAARCQFYMGESKQALDRVSDVLKSKDLPIVTGRMALSLFLQVTLKLIEDFAAANETEKALDAASEAADRISECHSDWFDGRVCEMMNDLEFLAVQLANDDGREHFVQSAQQLGVETRRLPGFWRSHARELGKRQFRYSRSPCEAR